MSTIELAAPGQVGVRKADMVDESHYPPMPGAAVLHVDRGSEKIVYANPQAAALLGRPGATLVGLDWWDALGVTPAPGLLLTHAVRTGMRTALPPLLLRPGAGGELVAGGYLYFEEGEGHGRVVILLFEFASGHDPLFPRPLQAADVVAVLGVDNTGPAGGWAGTDIARHMIDIRFGLQQIVPTRDDVGMPVGMAIPIALRDTTIEQAQDIGKALLSHLAPLLAGGARIRVGFAQCGQAQGPLEALIAANNALLRLQRFSAGELITAAGEGDEQLLATGAANADGIFAQAFRRRESYAYLCALAALSADPQHGGDYLAQVVAITLLQKGVAAVAVYRRRYDDSYDYVAGGLAGEQGAAAGEKQLPRAVRQFARKPDTGQLRALERIDSADSSAAVFPLRLYEHVLGFIALGYRESATVGAGQFAPDVAALHHLAKEISILADWRQAGDAPTPPVAAPRPVEERIDGYVGDNMEGAIDQAVFLSRLDVPVAIIGPRGTGKLYVAKVIHQESGAPPEKMVSIDCREFRGRKDALNRIARELERSAGKTLVFKSPHLMNPDAQLKLARQISSRILADTSPPRYLPAARIIALFPDSLEHLVRHGALNDRLASVFAAFPIRVPPIKDRKRAVLRWAHKILAQEGARRDRKVTGFTPDAEQAMLQHDWPGNISEMRQCITSALDKTEKEWLTPVDLGIFKGLSAAGPGSLPPKRAYLQALVEEPLEEPAYAPATQEELGVALGEALHTLLELDTIKPLGAWLDDEVVLAACERYRDNMRAAADFLQTRPRNIARWMPKILSRDHERSSSSLWLTPQRLIRQWIRESAPMAEPPQQLAEAMLLAHVVRQCEGISVADRARIMGVSTPTYQKRLQDILGSTQSG